MSNPRDFIDLSYLVTADLRALVANPDSDRDEIQTATYILSIRDKVTAELSAKEFTLGEIARKPTAAQSAIATADSYLQDAVLPTYSELMSELRKVRETLFGDAVDAKTRQCVIAIDELVARCDRTLAGDFKG